MLRGCALVVGGLLVGCSGGVEQDGATDQSSDALLGGVDLSDPCTTQSPDAVYMFSTWANGYASTASTAYAARACNGLILETNGLATLVNVGTRDVLTGSVRPNAAPSSKGSCEATSTNVTGYGYLPSTGRWERFGYATQSGVWSGNACTVSSTVTSGWPTANRYTKVRFVARAKQTTSGWVTLTSVLPVQIQAFPGRMAY